MEQQWWARKLLSVAVCFLAMVPAASAMDITTCGTTVSAGDVGVLQADLDCSTTPGVAVYLLKNALLELNSHALIGYPVDSTPTVSCLDPRCSIAGPGDIANANAAVGGACVLVNRSLEITDANIHDCAFGIQGELAFQSSDGRLAATKSRVYATRVNVSHSAFDGIVASLIQVTDVTISESGRFGLHGVYHIPFLEQRWEGRVRGVNVTVINNHNSAVYARNVALDGLTATGNGTIYDDGAVAALRLRLSNSEVADSGSNLNCDVYSPNHPRVTDTICGTSCGGPAGPWGVCTNDGATTTSTTVTTTTSTTTTT